MNKRRIFKSALLLSFFTVSNVALAEQFEKENELIEQANQGETKAMWYLYSKYCEIGDYQQSLYWQEKYVNAEGVSNPSFEKNLLADAYQTGHCDPYGKGRNGPPLFPPNYAKAIEWFNKVVYLDEDKSSRHYFNAQFSLAEIYFWGKGGTPKDGMRAKRLYEEIANSPDVKSSSLNDLIIKETRGRARHRLAQMFYFGDFTRQDYVKAYDWAMKSLQDYNSYGTIMVARMQYEGKGTKINKAGATDLMGRVCDTGQSQQACDWYQDMRDNRPLRAGSL